ncbi:MAG TPA: NADH-quinone oxidoreductase subunit C, partial [Acidobacteriaceae bacterium]
MQDAYDKAAVLAEHGANPAIQAIQSAMPAALLDAKFDRGELTLKIAREYIRAAATLVQKAGYNFLEDVTCVDYYPGEPRFQVIYHIVSYSLKARLRLAAPIESIDLEIDSIVPVWPSADFYEREVFDLFGIRFGGHPNLRR